MKGNHADISSKRCECYLIEDPSSPKLCKWMERPVEGWDTYEEILRAGCIESLGLRGNSYLIERTLGEDRCATVRV